ncbi:hypothetical protein CEXT_652451 [Caerostris extrusa]|uniref:Ribosomal protein L31 n=1 Tax=Caerostris extrusa TaxID=172846 RepID=A0AAV4Y6Y8_CAEEX|nr:hypothetical protein CEXT_652451 [Caerostris extrusa]
MNFLRSIPLRCKARRGINIGRILASRGRGMTWSVSKDRSDVEVGTTFRLKKRPQHQIVSEAVTKEKNVIEFMRKIKSHLHEIP